MSKLNYSTVKKPIEKFGTTFPLPLAKRPTDTGYAYRWGIKTTAIRNANNASFEMLPIYKHSSMNIFVDVSVCDLFTMLLDKDGNVIIWGDDTQPIADVIRQNMPSDLRDVVAIMAISKPIDRLRNSNKNGIAIAIVNGGKLVIWSSNPNNVKAINDTHPNLYNKRYVSMKNCDFWRILLLADDGTITDIQYNGMYTDGEFSVSPKNNNVIDMACTTDTAILIKADGSIDYLETSYIHSGQNFPPPSLNNIKKITSMSTRYNVLDNNGTVISWGRNVVDTSNSPPVKNIFPLNSEGLYGLTNDNKLIVWLTNDKAFITSCPPKDILIPNGINDVITLSASGESLYNVYDFYLCVLTKTTILKPTLPPSILEKPVGQMQFYNMDQFTYYPEDYPNNITSFAYNYDGFCAIRTDKTVILRVTYNLTLYDQFQNINDAVEVYASLNNFIVLREDGTIVVGGNSANSIYGIPAELNVDNHKIISVSLCFTHALALRDDGKVFSWAHNTDYYNTPVPDISNITAISTYDGYSLALDNNGKVYTWGSDRNGKMNVSNYTNIKKIMASSAYSLLLDNDGDVIVVADFNNRNIKAIPSDAKFITDIKAAGDKIMAIKEDGTLISWGATDYFKEPSNVTNVLAFGNSPSLEGPVGLLLKSSIPLNTTFITPLALLVDKPQLPPSSLPPNTPTNPQSKTSSGLNKLGLGIGLGLLGLIILIAVLVYFFVIKKKMIIN